MTAGQEFIEMVTRAHIVALDAATGTASRYISGAAIGGTNISFPSPATGIHCFLDEGQAYYWKHSWQVGERETIEALARGEGRTFANAQDTIKWLLSIDDDE